MRPLIRKVYVPKSIFVIATVLAGTVNLLISLVPLALIMLVLGHPFSPALAFLPVPILLTTLFSLGISLALAPPLRHVRRHRPDLPGAADGLDVLTPVIYPLSALPERYRGSSCSTR